MTQRSAAASLSEASKIARFMGLTKWRDVTDLTLVSSVTEGLPTLTAYTVVARIDPEERFLRVTDIIPKSTLHRREKDKKPLSKDDSEKILALSKVFSETLRIYNDDTAKAAQFLSRAHPMLGNKTPVDLAKNSIAGADLVLKLLARAAAGVAA